MNPYKIGILQNDAIRDVYHENANLLDLASLSLYKKSMQYRQKTDKPVTQNHGFPKTNYPSSPSNNLFTPNKHRQLLPLTT
jgi:hypothetical protein